MYVVRSVRVVAPLPSVKPVIVVVYGLVLLLLVLPLLDSCILLLKKYYYCIGWYWNPFTNLLNISSIKQEESVCDCTSYDTVHA